MNREISILVSALTVTAVCLGGCASLSPEYKTPPAPILEKWSEGDEDLIKQEPAEFREWWKVFKDPILDKLVETAYAENLSLQIAGLRVLEARAQLGIAMGNMFPQRQELNAGYNTNKSETFSPGGDKYFDSASLGFDASWEVDFWGKFRSGIKSDKASLMANIASYDDVLVTLTAEVARTYVVIRTLEERIRLAMGNVKIQRRAVELTTEKFNVGTVTELDVTQSKTLLKNTQSLIPTFQIFLRRAQNSLSILMGMPPQDLKEILEGPEGIPSVPAEVALGVPSDLLRRRPDIKQAELQALAQGEQIGIARAEMLPSFSLDGNLGWNAEEAGRVDATDVFESIQYTIGPSVNWKLLNYGRLMNQVRVQDALFEQLLINYRNVVLNAAREVEDALAGFILSQIKEELLFEGVEAAKRSSDLSMVQYKEGISPYQRVLDSNRALQEQQDSYAQTKGDIVTNLIAMYKALGGGWQARIGEEFVPESVQAQMKKRTYWGKMISMPNNIQNFEQVKK